MLISLASSRSSRRRRTLAALKRSSQRWKNLNRFVTASEKFAAAMEDLRLKYAAVSTQIWRREAWIKKLAEKAGIMLEF
jgi:hypothetical protein